MMQKLLTTILNAFALGAGKRLSSRLTTTLVLSLVGCSLMLCAWMGLHGVKDKFVFMVDAVEIGGADSVTIGRGSDVSIQGVPTDYLCVKAQPDGSMLWRKNPAYSDSLQYIKINNANPNVHAILNDTAQRITVSLPYAITPGSQDSTISVTLTGADIWREWRAFSGQQNVLLRHLAAHQRLAAGATGLEAARLRRQIEISSVRSFLHAHHSALTGSVKAIDLVIIDHHTTVDGQGYTNSGTTLTDASLPAEHKDRCKVQFFNIATGRYCTNDDDGGFQIDGVNYTMKATPLLTAWGAGHTMIRRTDHGMRILFPKAIGYVGSLDSLRTKSAQAAGLITFRQTGASFPTSTDLYLPQFSDAFGQDICNIEFSSGSDTITIHDSNSHTIAITAPRHLFTPTLQPITLRSGQNTLECRVGIINGAFVMSYIWLPLLTLIALLALTLGPWSPFRIKSPGPGIYSARQLRHFPTYLASLLTIAFVYCICKSLIALKLSYTYPYFEKITAITPVATTLMLILAFTLILILNHRLITYTAPRHHTTRRHTTPTSRRPWIAWSVTAALYAITVYTFFGLLDQQVSRTVIESYFPSEVAYTSRWWTTSAYGVVDNHRTIPYALITIEGLLLIITALTITFAPRLTLRAPRQLTTHIINPLRSATAPITRHRHWTLITSTAPARALTLAAHILWPTHIIILTLLAIITPHLGNFGTAFITLTIIPGLSRALTSVRIADPNQPHSSGVSALTALLAMIAIATIYITGAMAADRGYLTNFLGFIMALLCFFSIMQRPGFHTSHLAHAARRERRWTYILTATAAALVIATPYLCSYILQSDDADYSRTTRRLRLYADFDNIQRSGYRYDESDAEFMVIMSHYLQTHTDDDALSNDTHPLHPSVSTGQSPVVLNDLSLPVAFIGAYGLTTATAVYFLQLLALILLVIQFSMAHDPEHSQPHLTQAMQWRLLALFMWVGTSYYIYFSYIGWIPFTGRLNPGFGVDAVGEALESAILIAYMATITIQAPQNKSTTNTQ